jgi:hypothetical protein
MTASYDRKGGRVYVGNSKGMVCNQISDATFNCREFVTISKFYRLGFWIL